MPDDAQDDAHADGSVKPSKADRLMAKAERLRERDAQRAERASARADAAAGDTRPWVIGVGVLGLAAVVLAVLLVVAYVQLGDRDDQLHRARSAASVEDTRRAAVLAAAKTWAVTFGAYDYQHLDADLANTSKYMTPSFAASYTKTTKALSKAFIAYKTQATASISAAAVISSSPSQARVLVLLDQVIKSTLSTTAKINRNRLIITLVPSKGHWLVSHTDAT